MHAVVGKIWSNFSHLSMAHVISRLLGFVFTVAMARRYGAAGYGAFALASACTGVAIMVADFGLDYFLMKVFGEGVHDAHRILPVVARMKLFLCGAAFIGVNVVAGLAYGRPMVWYVLVLSLILFPDAVYKTVTALMRADNEFGKPSRTLIMTHLGRVALAGLVLQTAISIEAVCAILVGLECGKAWWMIRMAGLSRTQWWRREDTPGKGLVPLVRGALPYALGGVAGILLWQVDLYLISYFKRMEDVGIYAAANSIVAAVVSFSLMLATAIFPATPTDGGASLRRTLRGILRLVVPASAGAAGMLFIFAPLIVGTLFQMPEAVGILRILCWTIIPISLYSVLTPFIYHASGVWQLFYVTGVGVIGIFFLDALLLPHHGIWVASAVDLVVESLLLGVYILVFQRRVPWSA